MSNIATVITSPYIIIPNSYDYYYCNSGSNIIILPNNFAQFENINIINNSATNLSIRLDTNVVFKTLSPELAIVIVNDTSSFSYKIVSEAPIANV
jgi:hypothetical protein